MTEILVRKPVSGPIPEGDYNEIDLSLSPTKNIARIEFWTAKQIGLKLTRVYPNRQWAVDCDGVNGIMVIVCPSLSTRRGYHLHIHGLTIPQIEEKAIRAAGEILERFNMTRGRDQDPNEFDHLPQTIRDEVIAPDAAPEPLSKPSKLS